MTGFLITRTVNKYGAGKHQWNVPVTDFSEFSHVSVQSSVTLCSANQTLDGRSITMSRFCMALPSLQLKCPFSCFFRASLGQSKH